MPCGATWPKAICYVCAVNNSGFVLRSAGDAMWGVIRPAVAMAWVNPTILYSYSNGCMQPGTHSENAAHSITLRQPHMTDLRKIHSSHNCTSIWHILMPGPANCTNTHGNSPAIPQSQYPLVMVSHLVPPRKTWCSSCH